MSCDKCDGCGSEKTYANQVGLPLSGRVRNIDWCIHRLVSALNAGGVETVACCCGHGEQDGRIDLADGRVLFIKSKQGLRLWKRKNVNTDGHLIKVWVASLSSGCTARQQQSQLTL